MSEGKRTLPPIARFHQESPHLALCLLRIWQARDSSPGTLPGPVYLDPPYHSGAPLSRAVPGTPAFVWFYIHLCVSGHVTSVCVSLGMSHLSMSLRACMCHRCLCVRDPL